MAHDVNLSVSPLPLADISWATSRLTLRWGKRTAGKWPETRLSPQALASLPAWTQNPYWVFRKDQSCNKIIAPPPPISIVLTILPTQPCHSCDSKCSPWLFLYEYCVPGEKRKKRWKEGSWENSEWSGPWRSRSHANSATGLLSSEEEEGLRVRCLSLKPLSPPSYRMRGRSPDGSTHPSLGTSAGTLRGTHSLVSCNSFKVE